MSTALPQTFIISLPASEERRKRLIDSLPKILPFSIVAAIDGSRVGDSFTIADRTFRNDGQITRREFACKMSHLAIMNHIVASGLPYALVLEDDVQVPCGFNTALKLLQEKLPPDFDIVYLSYNTDLHVCVELPYIGITNLTFETPNFLPKELPAPELLKAVRVWGTPAYLISSNGAKKILKYASEKSTSCSLNYRYNNGLGSVLSVSSPTQPIDLLIMSLLSEINGYISWPMIAYPNMDKLNSTIGPQRGYDRPSKN